MNGSGRRHPAALLGLGLMLAIAGCATSRGAVSPEEIPELRQRLARDENNPELVLRYAAALYAADDCDLALPLARRGMRMRPGDVTGPLVAGQCLERQDRLDEALELYEGYATSFADSPAGVLMKARQDVVARRRARILARSALEREDSLAALNDPEAMAVLPVVIVGGTELQPLSFGLAHMMTSDLALLERFRLVERLELRAILEELQLATGDRVDPATAARVGRTTRAGRILQGVLVGQEDQDAALSATVALTTAEAVDAGQENGRFEDLLELEKRLVLSTVEGLGYQVSEAERQRILQNGTRNLLAFLAFSRGLMAEEQGDYAAAAAHYAEAFAADPGFGEARERQGSAAALDVAVTSEPGEVTTLTEQVERATGGTEGVQGGQGVAGSTAVLGALSSSIADVAGLQAERPVQGTGELTPPKPPPPPTFRTIIRIILPIGDDG